MAFNRHLQALHDAARDMAQNLGVSFHVAKVNGFWGVYAGKLPTAADKVATYTPLVAGDEGAAHGRFTHE